MVGVLLTLALIPLALAVVGGIMEAIDDNTIDPQLKAMRDKEESERVEIKLSYKDMMENKVQSKVNVRIGDKQYVMSEEEFEVTKQVLKNNNPERVSEGGSVVYVF